MACGLESTEMIMAIFGYTINGLQLCQCVMNVHFYHAPYGDVGHDALDRVVLRTMTDHPVPELLAVFGRGKTINEILDSTQPDDARESAARDTTLPPEISAEPDTPFGGSI